MATGYCCRRMRGIRRGRVSGISRIRMPIAGVGDKKRLVDQSQSPPDVVYRVDDE